MQNFEYQLELSKFDEVIANAELHVVQAQLNVSKLKLERSSFVRNYGEALVTSRKQQELPKVD